MTSPSNFVRDLRQFLYWSVQKVHQILESPWSAPTIASKTLKNIGFDTLIVWTLLRLHDPPSNQSRPLTVLINPPLFFLWLVALLDVHLTTNPPKSFHVNFTHIKNFSLHHMDLSSWSVFWSKHEIPPSLHPSPCDSQPSASLLGMSCALPP